MDFSNIKPSSAQPTQNQPDPEISAKLDELPEMLPVQSLERKVIDSVVIEAEHQAMAKEQADQFDVLDTNSVLTFAIKPQKEYTESLKLLLGDSKVRDIGVGADIIKKIKEGMDIAEVDKMQQELAAKDEKGSFLNLPFFKKVNSAFTNWEGKRKKLQTLVDNVETSIQDQMDNLIKENARLDVLTQEVRNNFYQLGVYLYAGELIVERGALEYKTLRDKAVSTGDALIVSDLMVMKGQLQAFDSRLLEIKKAYVSAPLEMQNILTIQHSARLEMQNQMNSLLFTVPKLIKSLVRLVSLYNVKNAQDVRDQHNQLNQQLDALAGQTLNAVATNAQQALVDAADEAKKIEQQAAETIALAEKLNEGSKEIKSAQENAEKTLSKVMDTFQKALVETQSKAL